MAKMATTDVLLREVSHGFAISSRGIQCRQFFLIFQPGWIDRRFAYDGEVCNALLRKPRRTTTKAESLPWGLPALSWADERRARDGPTPTDLVFFTGCENQTDKYFANQSVVRCQAKSAAALL